MYFLRKVQLHVSALGNDHLQVVHEILIKQLYKTYMGCLYRIGRGSSGNEISYLSERLGGVGYMRGPCCYQAISKLIIVKSLVCIILSLCVLCNYTKVQNIKYNCTAHINNDTPSLHHLNSPCTFCITA